VFAEEGWEMDKERVEDQSLVASGDAMPMHICLYGCMRGELELVKERREDVVSFEEDKSEAEDVVVRLLGERFLRRGERG
jgi:hypothetical protein